MNKNEECDVVRDLSSLYLENMVSESSKKIIEKHLKDCKNCEQYYNNMNNNIFFEEKIEKENDKVEINHLKKVNKKIQTLKWTLTIIIILILVIIFSTYCRIVYIDNINNTNITKMLNMQKNSTNYKLVHKTIRINKDTNETNVIEAVHYYKDGKHKEIISSLVNGEMKEESIRFIEDNSYEKITVFHSLKQIDYQTQDFIEERKGNTLNLIISRVMLNDAGIHRLGLKTRTEFFDNKECYVVSDAYNGEYRENYIDKSTGDLIRVVSGYGNCYEEQLFSLTEGNVTDEDVDNTILKTDEKYKDYKINNITYELDEIFKQFYK